MNNEKRKDNFIYVLRKMFTIITFTLTMYKLVVLYPRIYVDVIFLPNPTSGNSARSVGLKNRKAYAALTWPGMNLADNEIYI